MKKIKYLFEALLLSLLVLIFKLMPAEMASQIGAKIALRFGLKSGASRAAKANIDAAFPEMDNNAREKILADMWDNLGRVVGEYAHLLVLCESYCEIENIEILEDIAEKQSPALFIGMHQANWEVAAMQLRRFPGLNVGAVYRAPNNPYADSILQALRDYKKGEPSFAKSTRGMRDMIAHLKKNGQIGLLIDQKYNEGTEALFFNRPAMTSTAYIELARKFDCPIIPVQMERMESCFFKMTVHPPLELNLNAPDEALAETHKMLEEWIRAKPAEWLWVHKRWKDSKKAPKKDAS